MTALSRPRPLLSKTQSLLPLDESFGVDEDDVVFSNVDIVDEDGGSPDSYKSILLSRQTWIDLGEPKVITVTVEPGDTLNGAWIQDPLG